MAEPNKDRPKEAPERSLRRRIRAAFLLQVTAIGMATVLGVYGAYFVLEDVLIRRALTEEAAHFAKRLRDQPSVQLPNTYNMLGYLFPPRPGDPPVPLALKPLQPGYGQVAFDGRRNLVHVSDIEAGRLYLVFAQEQLMRLAVFFGFVPLSFVLVAIYLIIWMTYRASKRAVSPVIWLANHVRAWDPKRPDLDDLTPERLPADAEGEVELLAGALRSFAERNQAFFERERNFTRDASHELRSPLTVIKIACDMLLTEAQLDAYGEKNVYRIRRSASDMSALIEAFLILAREGDTGLLHEDFIVNDVVLEQIDLAQSLVAGRAVQVRAEQQARIRLHAPSRVLAVVVGNLIRNACQYTESGEVVVIIARDRIEVRDTGVGIDPGDLQHLFEPFYRAQSGTGRSGYGIGLTIVKRLSDRFGWRIEIDSQRGVGTRFILHVDPVPIEPEP